MDKEGKLMTAPEVAKITRLHEATIRRLAREGKIPYVRLNNYSVRFKETDILEWINDGVKKA